MGESAALETLSEDELPVDADDPFSKGQEPSAELGDPFAESQEPSAELGDPFAESQNDLNQAIEELSGIGDTAVTSPSSSAATSSSNTNMNASDLIWDIPVEINIIMGSASLTVARLMELENGEVVELDRRVGEPLDIAVNGRNVAKGEIVMMDDDPNKFAIQVTELVGR